MQIKQSAFCLDSIKKYLRVHFSWKNHISAATLLFLLEAVILKQIHMDKNKALLLENTKQLS